MKPGDEVQAIHMPHLGTGIIDEARDEQRLWVIFLDADGGPYEDAFSPHELRVVEPAAA